MTEKLTILLILIMGSLFSINPITDLCWDCMLPITVSGQNVTPGHEDQIDYDKLVCYCTGVPPKAGIPVSFYEPAYLVDVTREPYKMLGMGGVSFGGGGSRNRGAVRKQGLVNSSFYHVHLYTFPLLKMIELFKDFDCITDQEMEVAYMSEYDPLWNDDSLAFIVNPEADLFSSKIAHLSCIADCASSNLSKPQDKLFWCAGCEGSLYPLTGTVSHHMGSIQASSLLVHRLLAKLHRSYVLKGYGKNDFCKSKFMPTIKKSLYKIQLVHPIAQTKGPCPCLGKSDVLWGSGKSYPKGGEDFVYLIWRKKQCCLDAAKKGVIGAY